MKQSPHASGKNLNLRAQVVKTLSGSSKMVSRYTVCTGTTYEYRVRQRPCALP